AEDLLGLGGAVIAAAALEAAQKIAVLVCQGLERGRVGGISHLFFEESDPALEVAHLLVAREHLVQESPPPRAHHFLAQHADPPAAVGRHRALVRIEDPVQDLQESGFAAAIRSHESDALRDPEREVYARKERALAVVLGNAGKGDHGAAMITSGRRESSPGAWCVW